MASNHAVVARRLREFVDRSLSPEAMARQFATIARGRRDDAIRSGEASKDFRTFVDGREGAREETTRPGGAVVYKFNVMGLVVRRALEELVKASPDDSGDFKRAWTVSVNGRPWRGNYDDIPNDADVIIVNPLPYSRKIEVGAMTISVPAHPIERVRQKMLRTFKSMYFEKTFVVLPSSFAFGDYETPYVLQGRQRVVAAKLNRRSRAFRQGRMTLAGRADTQRGQKLTYPALTIKLVR